MIAGMMKYKIELLQPQTVTNEYGEEENTFVLTRTVWAERVKNTGKLSEELGEHFADYSVEFNIRDAHPVSEGWRVHQLGGLLYLVTNIRPNLDKGMLTLQCERVNE